MSGASDGIVSAASLVVGVAAAASSRQEVLIAGVAGLVAGALSMAGEYVSVSSQADTEQADLKRERHELATEPQAEEDELTGKTRPSRRRRIPAATRQRYGANDIVEAVGYP